MAINIHYQDDTGGYEREYGQWKGLLLSVSNAPRPTLRLRTAFDRRMRLDAGDLSLLWAEILDGYHGVTIYRNLPQHQNWLPSISSTEVQRINEFTPDQRLKLWFRYFVQVLRTADINCMSNGLWSLEYCDGTQIYHPHWCGSYRLRGWQRDGDDMQLLHAPTVYLDWNLNGNGQVLNLFAPQHKDSGRVKWWRKLVRNGQLPPILVWYIHGLNAYLVLDGHDRLQASLLEDVRPTFAVLSSFYEIAVQGDPRRENAILQQVNMVSERVAQGLHINPSVLNDMQQLLAKAFDRRPMRRFITRSSATLNPQTWDDEVAAFMRQKVPTGCIHLRGL
jgi:hypothetical protein